MRITGIEIDRFGVWQDFKQPLHRSGLTVFCGPNEAGKTTLLMRLPVFPKILMGRYFTDEMVLPEYGI